MNDHDDDYDPSNIIAGWQLGHSIAHGHHGFPGDPLPDGHLGRAADLAFWGSVFSDDRDDTARADLDDPAPFDDYLGRLD